MSKVIDQLLEGVEGLTPEFKEKVQVVFEAAVQEAVDAELAVKVVALTEATDEKATAAINEQNAQILETLDVFLSEAVQEWITENAVALDSSLKVQIGESFVEGLAALFASHNVKFDESTTETLGTLEAELAAAKTALTEATDKLAAFAAVEATAKRTAITESKLEGLADTTKDRIKKIVESMEFKSDEDYATKLGYLVEAVAGVTGEKPGDKKKEDGAEGKTDSDGEAADKEAKDGGDGADKSKDTDKEKEAPPVNEAQVVDTQEEVKVLDPVVEATLAYMRKSKRK